jgi:hypothetical protein
VPSDSGSSSLDAAARQRVFSHAQAPGGSFFPFGTAVAAVHARPDGVLVFELKGHDFPLQTSPVLVIEDLPSRTASAFGTPGRIWAGNRQGLREVDRSDTDAETLALLAKILDALRRDSLLATTYRSAVEQGLGTRETFQQVVRLERTARRSAASRQDLEQSAAEAAERLCPGTFDAPGTLADALAVPPPLPAPEGPPPALVRPARDWESCGRAHPSRDRASGRLRTPLNRAPGPVRRSADPGVKGCGRRGGRGITAARRWRPTVPPG